MSFESGTTGYVKVGSTSFAFDKWRLALRGGAPKVTNFTSGGYQQLVPGVVAGTITASGPFNVGSMAFAINGTYVFLLGTDTGQEISVPAQVTAIDVDNSTEDAPRVSITAESSGAFTAGIT